jgi:hypothetical protein
MVIGREINNFWVPVDESAFDGYVEGIAID